MPTRSVAFVATPTEAAEAPGVTILRSIGSDRMVLLDPLLLMDHLTLVPSAGNAPVGFPRHPHRGIETLTYVFRGRVQHRDSLGNQSAVGPGGTQWMTAGDGIWHEEMLVPEGEGTEALQVWFSLPLNEKRKPAGYLAAQAPEVPEVRREGALIRVVCGEFGGQRGPVDGIAVQPLYLDVQLSGGTSVEIPVPSGDLTVAYVARGSVVFGDQTITSGHLVTFATGDSVVATSEAESRFILISAAPLNEPVVQYRSFVMNTVDDIGETLRMIADGTFAGDHPGFRE